MREDFFMVSKCWKSFQNVTRFQSVYAYLCTTCSIVQLCVSAVHNGPSTMTCKTVLFSGFIFLFFYRRRRAKICTRTCHRPHARHVIHIRNIICFTPDDFSFASTLSPRRTRFAGYVSSRSNLHNIFLSLSLCEYTMAIIICSYLTRRDVF